MEAIVQLLPLIFKKFSPRLVVVKNREMYTDGLRTMKIGPEKQACNIIMDNKMQRSWFQAINKRSLKLKQGEC